MKTIIEMAREVGLEEMWELTPRFIGRLEAFAELVRADERDRAMRENAYVLAEREACAIAGGLACRYFEDMERVQNAIRARGNT